jgi:hypothetical protein
MNQVTLLLPHPIVFVLDPTNKDAIVPDYVPGGCTASTSSCISVATTPDVDGEVILRLCSPADAPVFTTPELAFEGSVETPGHVLAVGSSEVDRILDIAVPGASTRVTISVDNLESPVEITVVVDSFLPSN